MDVVGRWNVPQPSMESKGKACIEFRGLFRDQKGSPTIRLGLWSLSCLLRLFFFAALLSGLGSFQPLTAQTTDIPEVFLELLVEGLTFPTDVQNAGDGSNRLFIAQQSGEVFIYDPSQNGLLPTPFLDISNLITFADEEGLFSIAFHPRYEVNGRFFAHYIDTSGNAVIARFTASANDPNRANPGPDAILLTIPRPAVEHHHDGGQIQFGPDGFLYIALGDVGFVDDSPNNGQNLGVLHGKILRLDVDSEEPYAIPPTNPFVNDPEARPEIWAYGLRNPWRFSFDRLTGEMFIADVGLERREEVSLQPAGSPGGENYGWRLMEGSLCFLPPTDCNDGSLVLPIIEYGHIDHPCGGSISGGYRYRGRRFPQLNGVYFYGDFCFGQVYGAIQQPDGSWTSTELLNGFGGIVTFGEDEDGEVYVTDFFFPGFLYRIAANNLVPTLTSLSPATTAPGGPDFTLTVNGADFVPDSVVRWNGADRSTTFVNATELMATILASDIEEGGTAVVTVFNPPPGGGTSDSLTFNITNPVPTLSSLSPSSALAGGAGFNLTVNGSDFVSGSVVRWNGSDRTTTFVSSTQLRASILASDIAEFGSAQISVFNPPPDGGTSNALTFPIFPLTSGPIPETDFQTIIPHSASGGGFLTRLFITNLSDSSNSLAINRVDQNGSVLESMAANLAPGATLQIADSEDARSEDLAIQWFAIGSTRPVAASVLFEFDSAPLDLDEDFRTAVGTLAAEPLTTFTIPVRVATAEVTVGMALANLSGASNTLTLQLRDESGNLVAQDSFTVEPFAQTAFSLHERDAFHELVLGTSEFVGSLAITTADTLQPVAALVIANNFGQLTSLPVDLDRDSDISPPTDSVPGVGPRTFIPHSATGGGFLTQVSLTNLASTTNVVTLRRYDQNGLQVENRTLSLSPKGTLLLTDNEAARSQELGINWFALRSDTDLTASVLFDFDSTSLGLADNFRTAVGALPSVPLTAFTSPVRVATVDVTIGLALANLTNSTNLVALKLIDELGNVVAEDSLSLGPLAQTAFSVHERDAFREIVLGTEEFLGSLTVTTTEPVAALAVGNNLNQLFSLPVVSGVAR